MVRSGESLEDAHLKQPRKLREFTVPSPFPKTRAGLSGKYLPSVYLKLQYKILILLVQNLEFHAIVFIQMDKLSRPKLGIRKWYNKPPKPMDLITCQLWKRQFHANNELQFQEVQECPAMPPYPSTFRNLLDNSYL